MTPNPHLPVDTSEGATNEGGHDVDTANPEPELEGEDE